jgi:hypothetical protein
MCRGCGLAVELAIGAVSPSRRDAVLSRLRREWAERSEGDGA